MKPFKWSAPDRIVHMSLVWLLFVWLVCAHMAASCPPSTYGSQCTPCPPHTSCDNGGSTAHDCRCHAGFVCMYFRQVHAVVTLKTTLAAFQNNTDGVRSAFVNGIAAAGRIFPEQVSIHAVQPLRARRALPETPEIRVSVFLDGADGLAPLVDFLPAFHVENEWSVQAQVRALKVSTRLEGLGIEENV